MDIQTILSQLKQLTTNLETVSAQISDNKPNPQVSSSDSLLLNRTSSASNLPNADNQTSDVLTLKNQILRLQTELNDLSKERDMWRDKYKELSGQGCISDSDTLTKSTLLPLTVTKSKSTTSKSTFSLLISNENQCFQTTYGTVIQTSHFSKTSVLLSWNRPPKTCLIIKKENDTLSESFLFQITRYLHQHNITVYVEPSVYQVIKDKTPVVTWPACKSDSFSSIIDFVITLGGDGTLLHLNTIFKKSVPPIVSFALGTLGFLTPFDIHQYETVLNTVLTSDLPLTLRTRLNCCFDDSNTSYTVLNDIVLDRGENCSMVNLECYIGDKHITTVHADGLIIATPTGSTAYSMAAGGSMVHPSVPAMLLTPICPHTLSFRQMILPDNVTLRVEVSMDSRTNVRVSFDGRHQHTLMKGQSISISVSIHPLPSVSPTATSNDWYTNVNESLNWNKQLCRKNQIFLQKQSAEI